MDGDADRFLTALESSQARSSRALEELSTGIRVSAPSDAPQDVVDILQLNARLSRGDQVKSNLALAKNEADIADTTLQTAINLMENALQIGAQGADTVLTADSRKGLASQVQQIHMQIVSLSQLNIQGRYVFSGDQDQATQYTTDPANAFFDPATGVARKFQATLSRPVTDLVGGSFQSSLTAEEIFDHRDATDNPAVDNAFAALTALSKGLLDNDTKEITDSISGIKQSLDHLNTSLAFYGGVESRIDSSTALVEKYQLQWKQSLSEKRDADVIQAETELQLQQTQQSAALGARAKFSQHSLFDFLS
jgi:flagellar hook-associated protein 3 FlgL